MHVGFAGAEVAAFDRIVEEAEDGVAVVLVILGGVDSTLGGDGVGTAGAVLIAEAIHLIAELGKGGGGGTPGESGAHHDNFEFPLIGRVDQFGVHLMGRPFVGERTGGDFGI